MAKGLMPFLTLNLTQPPCNINYGRKWNLTSTTRPLEVARRLPFLRQFFTRTWPVLVIYSLYNYQQTKYYALAFLE